MEIITEQELDKLWLDMSFTQDYINNKKVYRKLRGNYSILIEDYNNINKGIDEIIEKYKKEINKCDCDTCRACQTYHKVIQDLKSLKG